MARFISISAIIGFFVSVLMLAGLAWYTKALRATLAECQQAHLTGQNARARESNRSEALQEDLENLRGVIASERQKIRGLEARLEAAGALRRCASNDHVIRG